MSDELEELRAVRDLLLPPENWTKGFGALDVLGFDLEPDSPNAVCWCIGGALIRISGGSWFSKTPAFLRVQEIVRKHGYGGIQDFNDAPNTTHVDALAVLDEAIAEVIAERTANA